MTSAHSLRGPARHPRRVHSGLGRGGSCGAAGAANSLSAAEALRDVSVVVLAGALTPWKSQAWGISEAYTPVNFPPVLRREAGRKQLSSFYQQLLQPAAEADYAPACGDLELAESAERAAGVTNSADHALVVPWTELPRLGTIFPGLRIRRFESAHDCWTSELKLSEYKYTSVAATRYRGSIVDATADAELWALPPGVAAWPADTPTSGEQAVVDVLVHAPTQSAAGRLVDALSRRGWADRVGDAGDWLHAGTPVDAAAKPPPRIAVAPPCAMLFSALERKPSRLPLARETPAWLDAVQLEAEATAALNTLACTRWCPPSDVKVEHLTRFTAEEVEEDTREFVLSISPARALAWMTDGALQSRRVALVAATQTGTVSLRLPDELRHECWHSQSESFAALAAATAGADAVAFFCNHANTRSHERAAAYAAWAQTPAGAQAGVRRDVRVYVVAGGGRALWKEAEMRGLQLSDLFLYWSDE